MEDVEKNPLGAAGETNTGKEKIFFGFINKKLIPLKLVYFIYISSLAVIRPYLALFMYELGLNPFQVGILRCLEPATNVLFSPIWGSIADKFGIRKSLLVLCSIGSAVFLPILLLVPPVPVVDARRQEYAAIRDDNNSREWAAGSEAHQRIGGGGEDSGDLIDELFPAVSLLTFGLTGLISLTESLFTSGFIPLLDAHTMEVLERYPTASYGGQRWPGALGVILFSPVSGLLMDMYRGHGPEFLPTFLLFGTLMLMSIIPVLIMEDATDRRPPQSFTGELSVIFSDFHILLTFLMYVIIGACNGIIVAFVFIYLKDLGGSQFLMGLSLTVTCITEIPCLLISGKVIERLGYEVVICLGLLAYAVRLFCYALLEDPWYVLPIETLHGVCYGLLWPACTEYAKHLAPEGMATTLQSLTHAAKAGIGKVLGIVLGGLLYNILGARIMFKQVAAVTMVMLIVYVVDRLCLLMSARPAENSEKSALIADDKNNNKELDKAQIPVH